MYSNAAYLVFISALLYISTCQVMTPEAPEAIVREHAKKVISSADSTACERACAFIADVMPQAVYLGTMGNYIFWDSKQSELVPACRVEPTTSEDVSTILKAVIKEQCHFAIRSGGHSRIAGSSNAEAGVTIDLVKLSSIEIAKDQMTVRIGAGSVWGDVYSTLEKQGLVVVGGRVSDVGIGGLTLGGKLNIHIGNLKANFAGGISFLSNRYGWACDSVTAFEVVLPDASIQTVTKDSNPDLYWALRGGGNNFGIVTAFHMELLERRPEIWRAGTTYSWDKIPDLVSAQHNFVTESQDQDLDAVGLFPYGYIQRYDMFASFPILIHLSHESTTTWPAAFKAFEDIEQVPNATELVVKPMSEVTEDIRKLNPYGMRTIYKTITYRSSPEVDKKVLKIYENEVEPCKDVEGIIPVIIFHPTPRGMTSKMTKNGGNALGIVESEPLTIMQTSWMWKNKEDDSLNYKAVESIFRRATEAAKEAGVLIPYIYQNYAHKDQDVFTGYGKENQARLKKVQRKVDPDGVFAGGNGLCRGYFKVNLKEDTGSLRDEL